VKRILIVRLRDDMRFRLGGGYVQNTNAYQFRDDEHVLARNAIRMFVNKIDHLIPDRAKPEAYSVRFRYRDDLILARMLTPPHLAPIAKISTWVRLRHYAKEAFMAVVVFPVFFVAIGGAMLVEEMREYWAKRR